MSNEPATKADLQNLAENMIKLFHELAERIDQRFEAVDRRFEAVDRRFEALENRLERMNESLVYVQNSLAGLTRWADRLDRDHSSVLATQQAQQMAIDNLAARVTRLEERHKSN